MEMWAVESGALSVVPCPLSFVSDAALAGHCFPIVSLMYSTIACFSALCSPSG